MAATISFDWDHAEVLASIAKRLADAGTRDPALTERALAVAATIPDDWKRGRALAAIARWLADADSLAILL